MATGSRLGMSVGLEDLWEGVAAVFYVVQSRVLLSRLVTWHGISRLVPPCDCVDFPVVSPLSNHLDKNLGQLATERAQMYGFGC
jgi:hypothetical protein